MVETIQPELANAATEPAASNNGTDEKAGDNDNFETSASAETSVANEPDPFLPEPPVSQCMVENLNGFGNLLGSQDIVRVDSTIIAHWKNLYGEKKNRRSSGGRNSHRKKNALQIQTPKRPET